VTGETIENVVSKQHDQCANTPRPPSAPPPSAPVDYGESLWLLSVTDSTVENSTLENGLGGGILVSDEDGPNFGNTIENNTILDNGVAFASCGITLAAHNSAAIFSTGPMRPAQTGGGRRLQQHR